MSATTTAIAPDAATSTPRQSWGALLVLLAGIFITTLDFFIVNVAIPATQEDLHATPAATQWVVAGFGLAVAAGLITAGRLGDIYGRRRMFAIGLALFTVASAGCGLAGNAEMLIAARVVQGAAAALLMPQVLGIVNVLYVGEQRVKAFTAYGLAMGFAGVFGQLIGGALIQADVLGLDWRSIYWINVPVGLVALVLVPRVIPETRGEGGTRLDPVGTVLVTLGLVAVVLPLVQGREQGWPLWTWLSLGVAPLLLGAFTLYQRRLAGNGGAPLVDPALFRERPFSVGITTALVYGLVNAAFFLILALYLQLGHGMSALDSGLLFIALGVGYFLSSAVSGRIAAGLGRQVLALGALVQGAGQVVLVETVSNTHETLWLIPGLALTGFGMGLVMGPMAATVLAGIGARHAGSAAGLLSTAQQVGGALGVALVGIVFYDTLGDAPTTGTFGDAFVNGLWLLTAFCAVVAALVQLLPGRRAGSVAVGAAAEPAEAGVSVGRVEVPA
ncbi:MFS transporter [Embleya scabrispora]|uniref:MFS transporter n=1 Tax=Embleya scabrispora TaxID=159449 RepID=UPI00228572A1|nr:MFS transporter [Embleya scabrispora]